MPDNRFSHEMKQNRQNFTPKHWKSDDQFVGTETDTDTVSLVYKTTGICSMLTVDSPLPLVDHFRSSES